MKVEKEKRLLSRWNFSSAVFFISVVLQLGIYNATVDILVPDTVVIASR